MNARRIIRLAATVLIATLIAPVFTALAQDLIDENDHGISPVETAYRIGCYFQTSGNHARAIESFTEAIAMVPAWGNLYAARGDSYASLGEHDLAIADYSRAIEIYPDFVSVLYARGQVYFAVGELVLARADYENALAQLPAYAPPYHGLGDLFYAQEQWGAALDAYEQYLEWITQPPNAATADAGIIERVDALRAVVLAAGA